ncbi:hypothetical protein [Myceligenerans crystallogenes]
MVMAAVNLLPSSPRRFILKDIGVRATDKASPSMGAQILARLRSRVGQLDEFAHAVFMPALAVVSHSLTFDEWVALAGPSVEKSARVYVNHPELIFHVHLLWRMPRRFSRVLLAVASNGAGNGPTIALNLLAEFDETARALYLDSRSSSDGRPPLIRLDDMSPAGRVGALSGDPIAPGVGEQELAVRLGELVPAMEDRGPLDDVDVEQADPRHVSQMLAAAAREWADRLDAGVLPSSEATGPMHRLASRLWVRAVRLGAGDLDGLVREHEDEKAPRIDPSRWWLLRLTQVVVPEFVTGRDDLVELAEQAALVQEHPADEALNALVTVIDLAVAARRGELVDQATQWQAFTDARTGLGQFEAIVSAASMGQVTLPSLDDVVPVGWGAGPELLDDVGDNERGAPRSASPERDARDEAIQADLAQSASAEVQTLVADESALSMPGAKAETEVEPVVTSQPESGAVESEEPAIVENDESAVHGESDTEIDQQGEASRAGAPEPARVRPMPALPAALAKYTGKAVLAPVVTEPTVVSAEQLPKVPVIPEPVVESEEPIDERATWGTEAADAQQCFLIGQARYGLAADLAQASGANAAQVAARRMVGYAAVLTNQTGALATEISQLAAAIDREELGDDRLGRLTAWAAAAKTALLAPSAGPAEVLTELLPVVSSSDALSEVTNALVDAARQGVVVVAPEAVASAGAASAATARIADVVREAGEVAERARTRTIVYMPAADVYTAWLAEGGKLHEVFEAVRTDDRALAPTVRKQIVDRLRGSAEKNIDPIFQALNRSRGRRVVKIAGKSRQTLVGRWDEVIELASRWAVAVDELDALMQAAAMGGSWQASALVRLRERIAAARADALDDLARLCKAAGLEEAAAGGPVELLAQTFAACDGSIPTASEPPAAYVRHGELLGTDLVLDPGDLLPDGPVPSEVFVALAQAPVPDPADVYEALARRGAHDLTEVLVNAVHAADEKAGAALASIRVRDVADADAAVLDELDALEADVDVRRVHGVLGDDLWARAASVVEALKERGRRDYERIRAGVKDLTAVMDREQARIVAETVAAIDAGAQDDPSVAEHAARLTSIARDGQVASAQEQLQQLHEGQILPGPDTRGEHLVRFFPTIPTLLSSRGAAEVQPASKLEALNRALRENKHNPVSQELAASGLDLLTLSGPRAKQAREAFSAWLDISAVNSQDRGPSAMSEVDKLRLVLRQAGIEFEGRTIEQGGSRERQLVTLTGVAVLGKPLTPVLGSGRSADGKSLKVLLVRKATTPASIIESLAQYPPDTTVLILWLARSALTAAEWRAVGESARGHANPPAVVMDPAVLVYLSAQAEPRVSSLAAITLPFTASNPYRDTPGDTLPEMFYGRTEERAALVDMSGSSFVSGGRQLGKSALLRQAKRDFEADSSKRVAIVETIYSVRSGSDPADVWPLVWRVLRERGIVTEHVPEKHVPGAVYDAVKHWLTVDPERRLLLMLDEADEFLDADAAGNRFDNVEWFRKLMLDSNRAFKVVLAGLHATARFESLPNQPLSHLGNPIVVGPLRPTHAQALLTSPLAAIGYQFDLQVTIASVLSRANNMPAQLQLIGQALVEHMASKLIEDGSPPSVIRREDVDEAFTPKLTETLRRKFLLTLALDPRYKVIAYVMANEAHERGSDASMSLRELSTKCREVWPAGFDALGADAFRGLVAECVALGVLARDETRYRLRTPAVRRLLGTAFEVLEELTDAADKLAVPAAYDGSLFRRPINGLRGSVSPLTERQLTEVYARGPRVAVVAGSRATGLDRVVRALEEVAPSVRGAGRFQLMQTGRADSVAAAVGKTTDAVRLVVDVRNAGHVHVREVIDAATTALRQVERDVSVIVVAGPSSASAWVGHPNLVELTRVGDDGMRLLAGADALPLPDPNSQARAARELGGWLSNMYMLKDTADAPGPQKGADELIDHVVAARVKQPGQLAEEAGVKPSVDHTSALALVLAGVSEMTANAREPWADIVGLLELEGDKLEAAVKRDGFVSIEQVCDALGALKVLAPDREGHWGVEPVLAADLDMLNRSRSRTA